MKIIHCLTFIVLALLHLQDVQAQGFTPPGWKAHPPYRLKLQSLSKGPEGISPKQILKAYDFPNNIQGSGQTIGIVIAYDNPNIEADLNVFSTAFDLPPCTTENGCFKKIYAGNQAPRGDEAWGLESTLDVEWAHAIAPLAKIILVEAVDSAHGLFEAITIAIQNHATVISCSWGGKEYEGEHFYDPYFRDSPVPIIAASGDSSTVTYPSASPYVLSVGGTYLSFDKKNNRQETGWEGSGGGISEYEPQPSYQSSFPIPQNLTNKRGTPDVAYNAAAGSGFSVYNTYGHNGWSIVGGTSAGTPQWAAIIALANSARGKNLPADINTFLYKGATTSYGTLFNDISEGNNGKCDYYCKSRAGYDYVTGLGTPKADKIINYLIKPD